MNDLYVIHWKYYDNSGSGVAAVFDNKESADRFIGLLEIIGDKNKVFILVEAPFYD
jgi:hypothetical protein